MDNQATIGLDLGGTFIKAVVVDDAGRIESQISLETQSSRGPDHVIERLLSAARSACKEADRDLSDIQGLGLGSPGPLSPDLAIVIKSANLPGWSNVPLRELLADLTGLPVAMTNDANAATYGEFCAGAGRGAEHVCMLTLGTGVGGGVVVNSELLHGCFGNAGELGHLIVEPGGRQCRCGQAGCLETVASASYLVERATISARQGRSPALRKLVEANGRIDIPDVLVCAAHGDAVCAELWAEACNAIARACVILQHAFNPQVILLGGGMAGAGSKMLEPVREDFARMTWRLADDKPEIRLASLGTNAGAIGAAAWFLHLYRLGRV